MDLEIPSAFLRTDKKAKCLGYSSEFTTPTMPRSKFNLSQADLERTYLSALVSFYQLVISTAAFVLFCL